MVAKSLARIALFGFVLAIPATPARAADTIVVMKENKFLPEAITVQVGDTVTWVNQDVAVHNATADDARESWKTPNLNQNVEASVTFDAAATFAYRCTIHPGMDGRITILPAAATPTTPPTDAVDPVGGAGDPNVAPAMLFMALVGAVAFVRRSLRPSDPAAAAGDGGT